jgi:hypothetical protein
MDQTHLYLARSAAPELLTFITLMLVVWVAEKLKTRSRT